MKLTTTRTGLFLAITGLLAVHGAAAQTTTPDTPTPPATEATDASARTLDAVEVRGAYIPEPMLETSEVASFVTKEDLQRTGDGNAAEALTRVTGLSLVQGKFVYVRGLGERYSSALLNGSPLPSPEPLQRVVPLDLFPSNVLERVTVQKTYSAKYPGEFGGGVIDLQTIVTPDEPFLTLNIGTGGNSETTFRDGLTYYGSDSDWWGFDDRNRKTPSELGAALATGRRVDAGSFSDAELRRIGRSFVNAPLNLIQINDSIDPDLSFGGSAGYSLDIDEGKLGFVAVAGFDNQWRTRIGTQQEGIVENDTIAVRTDYDFVSTQNDARLNVLVGSGYERGDHKVALTTLYVHDTTKEARSREGNDENAGARVRDDYTEWFERDLTSHQLTGSHAFGEFKDLKIDWRGAYAKARRQAPYEKGIRYRVIQGTYLHDASQEQNYTRFSTVEDVVVSGGVDVSWRLPIERDVTLSAGLAYSDNDRTAESREFRFLALNGALPDNVRRQRVDFLLSDYNIDQGLITLRETTGAEGAAAYDATLKVAAAYLQAEAEIVPLVRGTVGVRFEDATQAVKPFDLFGGAAPVGAKPLRNDYVLPAATITWNFAENQQIRFGASQTIARPQFRELAPQQYFDTDTDRLYIGNPFLVDSELTNLDARYEWFFAPGEAFTVGVFYKDIERPVESIVNEAGSTIQQTFINAPQATLYGLEVDVKKYLDLPIEANWWGDKRLYVAGNYTYTQSEVTADQGDTVVPLGSNGLPRPATELVRDGSRLQGQSEHIANLQFGIEDAGSRSQATLVATYVGERISARGRPGQPDFLQKPGTLLDLVVRKGFDIGDTELTLGLEARNLLGTEYQEFQELGGGRVDINRYEPGRSYSFTISASF
ncbi:MAG TPA: TonB-dependent receptor [Pseudoxanthomonas sp.]|nr:TonB-dependent receptor [Pseudoxanthomonas sp.]